MERQSLLLGQSEECRLGGWHQQVTRRALDDSGVSDCDDTPLRTDDRIPASCTPGSVLGVGDTKRTFSCLPEGILSGTQPVCPPLPFLAPNIESESIVDVRIDRTAEGSRMVSGAGGSSGPGASPIAGDPAVWTRTTNDSWMNDGLVTCAFVGSESRRGWSWRHFWRRKCPWCGRDVHVCVERQHLSQDSQSYYAPSEFSLAVVLPASAGHDGNGLPFHEDFS